MGNAERFSGKVALVTGGASGIGAAVARRLHAEGARVASLDVHGGPPNGVLALTGDVSRSADVEAAVAGVHRELGPIDILVCSAGVPGASLPTVDVTDEEWRRVMGINADGVFYCNRAVIPSMVERGYGRIVNIASIAGKNGTPNFAPYGASKAAVIALTKALGRELADTEILANAVCPSVADTDIIKVHTPEKVKELIQLVPKGRFVRTDEIAAMVAWLSSEECSFSTGQLFDISGGRSVY